LDVVKVPRPSLDGWSKALLKAREAQTILTKPNFTTEETWENDSLRGMALLNERFERVIPPHIIFIDASS
jgi:hypothetical protein